MTANWGKNITVLNSDQYGAGGAVLTGNLMLCRPAILGDELIK